MSLSSSIIAAIKHHIGALVNPPSPDDNRAMNYRPLGRLDFLGDFGFGLAQFDQHLGIGDLAFDLDKRVEFAADGIGFVEDGAGVVLIGPEGRAGHDVF